MKLYCFMSMLSAFFFVTRRSGVLVCISWSCFLLFVVLFNFCFFFRFSFIRKEGKNGHSKNEKTKQKKENMQKKDIFGSVIAVVFTNSVPLFWGWA